MEEKRGRRGVFFWGLIAWMIVGIAIMTWIMVYYRPWEVRPELGPPGGWLRTWFGFEWMWLVCLPWGLLHVYNWYGRPEWYMKRGTYVPGKPVEKFWSSRRLVQIAISAALIMAFETVTVPGAWNPDPLVLFVIATYFGPAEVFFGFAIPTVVMYGITGHGPAGFISGVQWMWGRSDFALGGWVWRRYLEGRGNVVLRYFALYGVVFVGWWFTWWWPMCLAVYGGPIWIGLSPLQVPNWITYCGLGTVIAALATETEIRLARKRAGRV